MLNEPCYKVEAFLGMKTNIRINSNINKVIKYSRIQVITIASLFDMRI